jgi:hypothetical protein
MSIVLLARKLENRLTKGDNCFLIAYLADSGRKKDANRWELTKTFIQFGMSNKSR